VWLNLASQIFLTEHNLLNSFYHSAPALWNTLPIQLYSLQNSTFAFLAITFPISQETQNSSFRSFLSYLALPSIRTASLFINPGFVLIIHSHFHLSFTLSSFAAFYFMDKLGTVLLNEQAFLCLAFCDTLNPPQSHLCLMFISFHVISYFSFFISQFFLSKLPKPLILQHTFALRLSVNDPNLEFLC
jgi:hypothetical protein